MTSVNIFLSYFFAGVSSNISIHHPGFFSLAIVLSDWLTKLFA